jgi:hypothetical protein
MSRNAVENSEFIEHKSLLGNDSSLVDIVDVIDDHSVLVSSEAERVLYRIPKHIVEGLEVMKFYLKQRNWMPKVRAAGKLKSNT